MHNNLKAKAASLMVLLVSIFLLSSFAGVQFVCKVSAAWPYDWPMFRHDSQHSGYSAGPAPTTNQTLWIYTTGGAVYSSPSIAYGLIYVGSGDNKVYALDAATGTFVWSYTTGALVYSSPAIANGLVYVGSYDHKIYALNASTGALAWSYTTVDVVLSSPAVAGNAVYVGSWDDRFYSLSTATGTLIWIYATGSDLYSSPAIANGVIYIGSLDNKVYAFSAEPPIPERLTIAIMLTLLTVAAISSTFCFHKRPKLESCDLEKRRNMQDAL